MLKSQPLPQEGPNLITRYQMAARKIGFLSREDEREVVRRWQEEKDYAARDKIIVAHQPLILGVLKRFKYRPSLQNDLLQEGNFGLMDALDKFDPEKGYRFATFAYMHVFAFIQQHARKNRNIAVVPVTPSIYRQFVKARDAAGYKDRDLDAHGIEKIASDMNLGVDEIYKILRRIPKDEVSLNEPMPTLENKGATRQDALVDERLLPTELIELEQAADLRRQWIERAMKDLNERQRHIVEARRLTDDPQTLEELSHVYNVSRERIRQIEERALRKMLKVLRAEFPFQTGFLFYDLAQG